MAQFKSDFEIKDKNLTNKILTVKKLLEDELKVKYDDNRANLNIILYLFSLGYREKDTYNIVDVKQLISNEVNDKESISIPRGLTEQVQELHAYLEIYLDNSISVSTEVNEYFNYTSISNFTNAAPYFKKHVDLGATYFIDSYHNTCNCVNYDFMMDLYKHKLKKDLDEHILLESLE